MSPNRILLFAATGVHNVGDEAILRAETDLLRSKYPEAAFRIATYDAGSHFLPREDRKIAFFSYFPNAFRQRPFANVGYFFRNALEIWRADLVIIGGGGLFYDNEGQNFRKQVFEWKVRSFLARIFRKPVFFWGIGVDVRDGNVRSLEPVFRGAAAVTVRDPESAAALAKIGIRATVAPDPAFLFDLSKTLSDPGVPVASEPSHAPTVGISIRP